MFDAHGLPFFVLYEELSGAALQEAELTIVAACGINRAPTPSPWVSGSMRMPVLQVVLPCLLAVNQATTDTNVVSREGQGPPGPQSCSPREYWIADRCCKACPAGQHVGEHCQRSHSWGQCVPCPPGTFMNCLNGMEACFKCSACSKNEEVLEECTPTDDLVCQCRPGYFYVGSSESCSPCSTFLCLPFPDSWPPCLLAPHFLQTLSTALCHNLP